MVHRKHTHKRLFFYARNIFFYTFQSEMSTVQYWIGLDQDWSQFWPNQESGLDRIAIFFKIGGSGLDRTEKIFFVLMW